MNRKTIIMAAVLIITASKAGFGDGPNTVGQVIKFDSIIQSDERIKYSKGIEESVSPTTGSLAVTVPLLDLPGKGRLGLDISQAYNSSQVGTFRDEDVSGGDLAQIAWMENITGRHSFGGIFYAKYGVIDAEGLVSEGMLMDTSDAIAAIINDIAQNQYVTIVVEIVKNIIDIILSYIHLEYIDNSTIHIYVPQMQPVIGTVKGAREPRGLIGDMTDITTIALSDTPSMTIDVNQFIDAYVNFAQSGNITGAAYKLLGTEKNPLKTLSVVMNDGSTVSFEIDDTVGSFLDHSITDGNGNHIMLYTTLQPDDGGKYILIYDYQNQEYVFMRGDGVRYHISEAMDPVIYVGGGDLNLSDVYNAANTAESQQALMTILNKLPSMLQLKGIPYGVVTKIDDPDGNQVTLSYDADVEGIPYCGVRRITNVTDALGRQVNFKYYGDNEVSDNWEMFRLKEIDYPDGRKTTNSYYGDQAREQPSVITITDPKGRNTVVDYKSPQQNQLINDTLFSADVAGAFFYINEIKYPIGGYVEYESSAIEPDRAQKHLYHDIDLTSEFVTKRTEYKSSGDTNPNVTTFAYQFNRGPTTITTKGLYLDVNLSDIINAISGGSDSSGSIVDFVTSLLKGGIYIQDVIEVSGGETVVSNMNGKVEVYNFAKNRIGNFNQWMFSLSAVFNLSLGDSSGGSDFKLIYGTDTWRTGYMPARLLQTEAVISGPGIDPRTEDYVYDGSWNMTNKEIREGLNDYYYRYEYDFAGNVTHEVLNEYGPINYEVKRQFTPEIYTAVTNTTLSIVQNPDDYMNYSDKDHIKFYPHLLLSESVYNSGGWQTTTCDYDHSGRLSHKYQPLGVTTGYQYTADGDIASVKDGNGNLTAYIYNYSYANNYQIMISNIRTVTSRILGPSGAVTTAVQTAASVSIYDRASRWLLSQTDPAGNTTSFGYDLLGRVTSVTYPDLTTLVYTYDDTPSDMKVDVQDSSQQLDGSKLRYRYDGLGRLWSLEKYLVGVFYSSATNYYKPWGDLDYVTDFLGRKTTLTYDALGRLSKIRYADNSEVTASYSYEEMYNNHKITLVNERGETTEYFFDMKDRLFQVNDANSQSTAYQYDDIGNLTNFTDAKGNGVRYSYDSLNRLNLETYRDGSVWSYAYDYNGNLTGKRDARFNNYSFIYDEMNRLVQSSYGGEAVNYGYDLDGRAAFWSDTPLSPVHTSGMGANYEAFRYDSMGRLTYENRRIEGRAEVLSYFYNSTGQLTNEAYPSGTNVMRYYDGLHRLVSMQVSGNFINYYYKKNDAIDSLQCGNGIIQAYRYDLRDRVLNFTVTKGSVVLMKQAYIYDASGNRTNFTDERGYSVGYAYDSLDRLTSVLYPESTGNASYYYDSVGNRNDYYYPYGHHGYGYNGLNELTNMTVNRDGAVKFGYDADGNLARETHYAMQDLIKESDYTWGMNDRLDRITMPQVKPDRFGPKTLDFVYTPSGSRLRKVYRDIVKTYTDRFYTYDSSGALIEEFDNISNRVDNIYIGSIRLHNGMAEYDLKDVLSSTILIADSSGKVLERYRYDPFGEIEQSKGNSDNRLTYNGKEQDEDGLLYYGARYYNGIIGRWISRDPVVGSIFKPDSLNRYKFCYNNPFKFIDLDGMDTYNDIASQYLNDNPEVAKNTQKWINANQYTMSHFKEIADQALIDSVLFIGATYVASEMLPASVFAGEVGASELEKELQSLGSSEAEGSKIANDAFYHVTTESGYNSIMEKGLNPDISGFVTKGKYLQDIDDPTVFNTMLYKQSMWDNPNIATKFNNGAYILQINSQTSPKYFSPFTNPVNGIPQWLFEGGNIPSSQIQLIKIIGGK